MAFSVGLRFKDRAHLCFAVLSFDCNFVFGPTLLTTPENGASIFGGMKKMPTIPSTERFDHRVVWLRVMCNVQQCTTRGPSFPKIQGPHTEDYEERYLNFE